MSSGWWGGGDYRVGVTFCIGGGVVTGVRVGRER